MGKVFILHSYFVALFTFGRPEAGKCFKIRCFQKSFVSYLFTISQTASVEQGQLKHFTKLFWKHIDFYDN